MTVSKELNNKRAELFNNQKGEGKSEMVIEYEIQGNYGYGWDVLITEETKAEAVEMLRCYNENERNVPHRIRKVVYNESICVSEKQGQ